MLHEDCAKLSTVELLLAASWRVLSSRIWVLARSYSRKRVSERRQERL